MIPISPTLQRIVDTPRLTKAQLKDFIREHGKEILRFADGELPQGLPMAMGHQHHGLCHDCHDHVSLIQPKE